MARAFRVTDLKSPPRPCCQPGGGFCIFNNMAQVPDWDRYFPRCRVVATVRPTQIGCAMVGAENPLDGLLDGLSGVHDNVPERLEAPTKYLWIEHAERNAIYNAARAGMGLEGCTLYCETPSMDCARAIVQAGIVQVVLDGAGGEVQLGAVQPALRTGARTVPGSRRRTVRLVRL